MLEHHAAPMAVENRATQTAERSSWMHGSDAKSTKKTATPHLQPRRREDQCEKRRPRLKKQSRWKQPRAAPHRTF
jgi:hypothetical protein